MIALVLLIVLGGVCAVIPAVVLTLDLLRMVHEDHQSTKCATADQCRGAYRKRR